MPDITDSVGDGGTNQTHDVSLVQVMLRVVKDAKGVTYLTGSYDGAYGPNTKAAILRFQQDQKLLPLPAVNAPPGKVPPGPQPPVKAPAAAGEKAGLVAKGSLTFKKLVDLLPANYKDMIALEKSNLVYLPGAEADAKGFAATVAAKLDLDATFRQKLSNVVTQMYADHKITMSIPGSGWRRDFARQLPLQLAGKGSSPGESNHQYGQGSDMGMNGLQWIAGDGTIAKANTWLDPWDNTQPKMPQSKRDLLWKARNEIAYKTLGLHPTSRKGDDVHVQGYSDATVNYSASLAKLLSSVGNARWAGAGKNGLPYKTDFGLGGVLFTVGTAVEIWQGKAKVQTADLVAAIKAAGKDLSKLPVFKDFQYVKDAQKAAAKAPAVKAPPGKLPPGKLPPVVAPPGNLPGPKLPGQVVVDGKAMKVTDIKAADIALVQKMLKSDWEAADRNWQKWAPVP